MRNRKELILGVVLGVLMILVALSSMGAIKLGTSNVDPYLGSNYPTLNIACSNDGSVVYVAGYARIYVSKNFGQDWEVVMTGDRKAAF